MTSWKPGIKVIDLMAVRIAEGRQGRKLFGGAGVGKTVVDHGADQQHRVRTTAASRCSRGVGERTREGNDLYHEMIDSGVIEADWDEEARIVNKVDTEGSKVALVLTAR